jgi:hypothetical protein
MLVYKLDHLCIAPLGNPAESRLGNLEYMQVMLKIKYGCTKSQTDDVLVCIVDFSRLTLNA